MSLTFPWKNYPLCWDVKGWGNTNTCFTLGWDPIAIKETVDQAAAYLGIGRVHNFLEATNQIMEQHGVTMTRLPQGTTDEASRFAKRLKRQMELFGKYIAKQQTDCPSLRRNINHWLADNCFGDD
ncbi:MAG TPA: hypothetical protein H9669_00845 [Firmicutes bacterium]|nr:hypothetical protein [Bacillota bacterium]